MAGARARRREVLAALASGGLLLAIGAPAGDAAAQVAGARHALGAWVRVGTDDTVTLLLSQCEIGQGVSTTLPAILADELGASWERVVVENAPVAPAYRNPHAQWMFTGNSESVATFAPILRRAAAQAREMLVLAAARAFGAEPALCRARDGEVVHRDGRRLRFGALAAEAARLPVPDAPSLRREAELDLIGRAVPRRDVPAKVDGSAVFGIDFRVDGMVYAVPRQLPEFGASIRSTDASAALALPGVIAVVPIPNGLAVVAEHFWQAKRAADALEIVRAPGPGAALDMAALDRAYRAALEGDDFATAARAGEAVEAIARSGRVLTRDYASPFQAHATLEPMNCTARVTPELCEVWAPTQGPEMTLVSAAAAAGLPPDRVRVRWTLSGGGFGRRLLGDFVVQAVIVARAVGRPVKLVWTREEDMTHDFYRPATLTRLAAALAPDGRPQALAARLVSPTQLQPVIAQPLPRNVDPRVTEGLDHTRYAIPHWRLDYHKLAVGVPTSVLRTTGFGPNLFALESFVDELAHEAGADPLEYRRALLRGDARARVVLDRAAEAAEWSRPLPRGHGRGIAFCEAFHTLMAQVVELGVDRERRVRVLRLVTVADPGAVFDPGIARANLEGGAVFGLTSVAKGEITFAGGCVQERNFDAYDMVRLWEMPPRIETHLIAGGGPRIGGLGEVGPVGIPPAFANALFAATGERVRSLPIARAGFRLAYAD